MTIPYEFADRSGRVPGAYLDANFAYVNDAANLEGAVPVDKGGTGATTLTDNGVVYGNGAAPVGATAEGQNLQLLQGATGSPPTFVNPSATGLNYNVANLAALKALTDRPPLVVMDGFIAAGDGGGGAFWWSTGSSASPNDGTTVQCTSGPEGRYIRAYSGAANVRWFGATGLGLADDQPAIQAAIDYVAANYEHGSVVYFPAGVYRLGSTLSVTTPGITLCGDGMRSTCLLDSFASGHSISVVGVDGVTIDGFWLSSTISKSAGSAAINWDNGHMLVGRNLRVDLHHYHAVKMTGGPGQYIYELDTCDFGHTLGHAISIGENGLLVQGVVLNDVQVHYVAEGGNGDGLAIFSASGISARNVSIAGYTNGITTYPFGAVRTGNTHGSGGTPSGLIDELSVTGLNIGMGVYSDGAFGRIIDIDSDAGEVTIEPPLTTTATGVEFYFYNYVVAGQWDSCTVDTCLSHGMRLWTNGGVVSGHLFNNLWAASNGAGNRADANRHGVYIVPGGNAYSRIRGISFANPLIANNAGAGMQIGESGDVSQVHVVNPNIGQNSVAGSGLKPGIGFYPGVSNCSVVGGFSGDGHLLTYVPNLQSYGILVGDDAGENLVFDGVNCTGNVTGGIYMGAVNSGNQIDCPGYVNVNSGDDAISAETSVMVAHGLDETPAISGITIKPTSDTGSGIRYWVSSADATAFTLTTSGSATFTFAWEARGPTAL